MRQGVCVCVYVVMEAKCGRDDDKRPWAGKKRERDHGGRGGCVCARGITHTRAPKRSKNLATDGGVVEGGEETKNTV